MKKTPSNAQARLNHGIIKIEHTVEFSTHTAIIKQTEITAVEIYEIKVDNPEYDALVDGPLAEEAAEAGPGYTGDMPEPKTIQASALIIRTRDGQAYYDTTRWPDADDAETEALDLMGAF